jgi:hypothetical protein
MINFLIILVAPFAISAYFVIQAANSRGHSILPWLGMNLVFPFSPLVYFILFSGEKPSSLYAKGLEESAFFATPMSLRLNPHQSRESIRGWLYLTRENIYWIPLDSELHKKRTGSDILSKSGHLTWELKNASIEQKTTYRDGIVNLLLLPPRTENGIRLPNPVALVIGTGLSISRIVGLSTIISRGQENPE